ncbi:hypothetical protein KIN20_033772 [Parelaphostrongylus tenuis]|uniref:Uncharacterized protein n=1 Tax=Parelaphostrongylus tenuis TaxID=148309 RepID=A0AAD5WJH9_PARTN|nr:hypothetical protein KIN20_033772 [Parelaphostrongylus tenuis]
MLAVEFDYDPVTIWHVLHETGEHCMKSKEVPHELAMHQLKKRSSACVRVYERYTRDQLKLEHVVTSDEELVVFYYSHRICG